MKMVKAVIRPEKFYDVLYALNEAGFSAATRFGVLGRGKQNGLKAGAVSYDEIPKEMMIIVVEDQDEQKVCDVIMQNARTGLKGAYGDGKIIVTTVDTVYTISSGEKKL
ncbi:nitrogen regulatory protein P-II [Syntrophobotulus glycolicus DSM 8271]|uniref:Nitrogen regulatory protein P-II n=1 Tax=Syntrophobotulus glycolicus (strain DSM 8271 / FlGlyR) TaxID=645991 RepID=F0T2I9_SYNGF|nr:P-II family nitrogen regulator [Syntrophobotulus glycolicus]ADY55307.1 nitrogen regulatory protein P-II [Syntrophobotulus glycolicus DSM 8271]